jgi:hypothetical protein
VVELLLPEFWRIQLHGPMIGPASPDCPAFHLRTDCALEGMEEWWRNRVKIMRFSRCLLEGWEEWSLRTKFFSAGFEPRRCRGTERQSACAALARRTGLVVIARIFFLSGSAGGDKSRLSFRESGFALQERFRFASEMLPLFGLRKRGS